MDTLDVAFQFIYLLPQKLVLCLQQLIVPQYRLLGPQGEKILRQPFSQCFGYA